ncbi:MAG: pyridoxamine 5'-phosphate oxidase family protein [Gammaproteobacteria bacterium]|nr:pyridoxamine 5'-phosphate oxidase family protein [Gammaproteobacteria bacterium]
MDEPLLTLAQPPASDHGQPALPERIRGLLEAQHYGVLCTQGGGQPYGSLVAFAFDEALTQLFFATPVTTRKFHLLSACDRVAMVVDSRASHGDELTRVEAVTVTGRAVCPEPGPDHAQCLEHLSTRHPHLSSFFTAPTTALVRVEAIRYLHVSRFQAVSEWVPKHGG